MGSTDGIYHKVEVLYLFSQGSEHADHPHLIHVHYPSHQQAPTLRDVKSRLTVLRGSGMPDSFSWSYKRSYRGAFVWCDVFDDDFILPLSESGEYVLKALEVVESSKDTFGRHAVQPSRMAAAASLNNNPGDATPIRKLSELHEFRRLETVSTSRLASTQESVDCPADNDTDINVGHTERSDVRSSNSTACLPEVLIENKRCLESSKGSDSPTDEFSTDESSESSFEKDADSTKEMPASPVMRSTDHIGIPSFPLPSLELPRKECVKSETWVVKEEVGSAPCRGKTSRRFNSELYDHDPTACIGHTPTPVTRACFPGYPFTFVLKKTAKFQRSQLCRRVEVVERLRAVTVEKPRYSRHFSSSSNEVKETTASHLPHSTKIGNLNWRLQRRLRPAAVAGRDIRSLSEFLGDRTNQSFLQADSEKDAGGICHAPRARKVRSVDCGYSLRREVAPDVTEVLLQRDRAAVKTDKYASDQTVRKADAKNPRMIPRPATRQSSRLAGGLSSVSFSPVSRHVLKPSIFFKSLDPSKEKALKLRKPLDAGILCPQATSDQPFTACEGSILNIPGENMPKVPKNVSKDFFVRNPVSGLEKKTSERKVFPWRENSAFDPLALRGDDSQEGATSKPKLKVQSTPTIVTSETGIV